MTVSHPSPPGALVSHGCRLHANKGRNPVDSKWNCAGAFACVAKAGKFAHHQRTQRVDTMYVFMMNCCILLLPTTTNTTICVFFAARARPCVLLVYCYARVRRKGCSQAPRRSGAIDAPSWVLTPAREPERRLESKCSRETLIVLETITPIESPTNRHSRNRLAEASRQALAFSPRVHDAYLKNRRLKNYGNNHKNKTTSGRPSERQAHLHAGRASWRRSPVPATHTSSIRRCPSHASPRRRSCCLYAGLREEERGLERRGVGGTS